MEMVTFLLADEVLAVETTVLREILEPMRVTRVPQAGAFAGGLINVRGTVVPVVDLRVALRLPRPDPGPDTRMLVLEVPLAGETTPVAVIADAVRDVVDIPSAEIGPVPGVGSRWPPDLVRGIARRTGSFIVLPDLPAIFATHGAVGAEPRKDMIA